jgi:hypothetical protein
MKRAPIFALVGGAVFMIALIGATYVVALNTAPTGQAITFTPGKVMHPPGCDIATDRSVSAGGLSLTIETTAAPTLHSPVCLHFVVRNSDANPFPAYKYIMEINVTDSSGKVVYSQNWGVSSPPNQLYNITTGNWWENGVFWYPWQSGVVTAGTYHVTATLFLPGSTASTYRASPFVRADADINVGA